MRLSSARRLSGEDQFSLSARVEQILWDFDRRGASIEAASARSAGSQAELRSTIRDIRIAARRALVDWQVAQERLEIGLARQRQLEQEWKELQQRVDAGLNPAIDARLTELQLIDSQNQTNDLTSAVTSAQLAMSESIALPVTEFPRITKLRRPENIDQRLSDAQALIANSPELDQLRSQGAALQADSASLQAGNLPEVAAFASGSSTWVDENDARESLQLGVTVRWTWDGGARSAGQSSAMNQYRAINRQRELLIRQRQTIWDDLVQQFTNLSEQIVRQERAITLAQQNETDTCCF